MFFIQVVNKPMDVYKRFPLSPHNRSKRGRKKIRSPRGKTARDRSLLYSYAPSLSSCSLGRFMSICCPSASTSSPSSQPWISVPLQPASAYMYSISSPTESHASA
ncbi:hypothetical protein H0G86_005724 [Trichoderma simmonsii]|uniref:Uncharacterized protein n=1 Tax=Trichoderma simmonsii TaxID=1491479 RepID=A0A8G0LCZ9_9HYPO|nr:hypothetical protein H0G86_005724 [Trichoderma simmonsii]